MKNILLMTDELRVGGAESYFYKIENNINRNKFDLYTTALNGSEFYKIKYKQKYIESPKSHIAKVINTYRIIKKKNITLVHANSLRMAIIAAIVKVFIKNKFLLIYTKHNITKLEIVCDKLFKIFVNKFVDKLIVICEENKKLMIKKGIKLDRLKVIYNGVNEKNYKFNSKYLNNNSNYFNIGILARISKEKNHEFFIDIAERIHNSEDLKNIKFFIGGSGPCEKEILSLICEKKLEKVIEMKGNIKNVSEFLSNMDMILIVSKREVFPMVMLESMSVGAIVVSVDVGGVSECVMNKKTGYLVYGYDKDKYIEIIRNIIDNKVLSKQIIENGRKIVEEKFTENNMINHIQQIYSQGS
ncbi:glycosyltransferase [Terrisporobacter sp.]